MVIFYDTERICIAFDLFLQFLCIRFAHPATENIECMISLLGAGRHFTHIEVDTEAFQSGFSCCQPFFIFIQRLKDFSLDLLFFSL